MNSNKPTHTQQRSGRCFVFLFAAFVMLCALLLVFASVVLRPRTPLLQLQSASLNHTPSSPFFILSHLTLTNPNFGTFAYHSGNMSVFYGNSTVGDAELGSGAVKGREVKSIDVPLNLRSNDNNNSHDILYGSLNLTTYIELRGTIRLLKIFNKKRTAHLACTIHLNLTSHSIHSYQC
ncbi:late embryogenesis abundant protein [Senna tora]|uniref:Late embryogenesis abundant protein n=1 Tax=Senna tora TaxID=362788 RepID=A0A834U1X1_9FABA|nr:late embryogenesis abundant protein [Senna tora]